MVTVHIAILLALDEMVQGVDLLTEVHIRVVHSSHSVHPVVHDVVPAVVVLVVLVLKEVTFGLSVGIGLGSQN